MSLYVKFFFSYFRMMKMNSRPNTKKKRVSSFFSEYFINVNFKFLKLTGFY